jgi:hypothetical protein
MYLLAGCFYLLSWHTASALLPRRSEASFHFL